MNDTDHDHNDTMNELTTTECEAIDGGDGWMSVLVELAMILAAGTAPLL